MRILSCTNVYPPNFIGGAELIAHHQSRELVAQGHQVEVFTGEARAPEERYRVRRDLYDGLVIHRVGLTGEDYRMDGVNFVHPGVEAQFARVFSEFQPDLVHFHNVVGLSMALLPQARDLGATTVVTLHDHWGFCHKNTAMLADGSGCIDFTQCAGCLSQVRDETGREFPIRLRSDFARLSVAGVDAFISPSDYLANAYLAAGFPASRMNVVWNGIDVERFAHARKAPSRGKVRFTYIGVLAPHKGVPTLMEAAALAGPRCELNIVGVGDRNSLAELAGQLGISSSVKFWGNVPNTRIEEVFSRTDVLVLPSVWRENQPVSVTEAMACGLPVIASQSGGLVELVEDEVTGFLFEPGNAAHLAERMCRFLQDPLLGAQLGAAGLERISHNTFAAQVVKLQAVYRQALVSRSRTEVLPLVVRCLGDRFDPMAKAALELLPGYLPELSPAFVLDRWPLPSAARPVVEWVVDATTVQRPDAAQRSTAPWLVPAAASHLAQASTQERRGLLYQSADEAAASLAVLIRASAAGPARQPISG